MATIEIKSQDPRVQYVVTKFGESRDYYRDIRNKFTIWDNQFFGIPDRKKWDWMSNLFVPATFKAVTTLLVRMVNAIFSIEPPYDVIPSSAKVSNLIRYQLDKSKFFNEFLMFLIQLLVRGTSIGKLTWKTDKKKRYVMEPVREPILDEFGIPILDMEQQITGYEKREKETIRYDGPAFEMVDLHDFFPSPLAKGIKEQPRIFRSIKTVDELRKLGNIYKDIDKVSGTEFPEPKEFPHSRLKELGMQAPNYEETREFKEEKSRKETRYVELLECECRYPNNQTKMLEDRIITVANREVIVRDDEHPFWNLDTMYVRGVFWPFLNEFYGIGVCELSQSLQEELNDKRNQRIDNVNQILQGIFMYERGSINPRKLRTFERKPGAKMEVEPGGINANKWDVAPDVTGSADVECANLEKDIEEVTGAVRQIAPSSVSGEKMHRTSSGLMLLQNIANERIKINVKVVENFSFEEILDKYYGLNQQFLPPNYKIIVPQKDAYIPDVYQPEDVMEEVEFRAKGSTYAVNQQLKLMNLMTMMDKITALQLPFGELHIDLLGRIYDALGFEDKDQMLAKLTGQMQQLQAKAEQMQQLEMMSKLRGKGATSKKGNNGKGGEGGEAGAIRNMSGKGLGMDGIRQQLSGLMKQPI